MQPWAGPKPENWVGGLAASAGLVESGALFGGQFVVWARR